MRWDEFLKQPLSIPTVVLKENMYISQHFCHLHVAQNFCCHPVPHTQCKMQAIDVIMRDECQFCNDV